jgi:hypothetical protein
MFLRFLRNLFSPKRMERAVSERQRAKLAASVAFVTTYPEHVMLVIRPDTKQCVWGITTDQGQFLLGAGSVRRAMQQLEKATEVYGQGLEIAVLSFEDARLTSKGNESLAGLVIELDNYSIPCFVR